MSSKFPKSKTAPGGKKIFQQSVAILGGLGFLSTNFLIPSAIATETLSIPDAPAPSFVDSTPAPTTPSVKPIAAPRPKVNLVAPSPSRSSRRRSSPDQTAVTTPRVRLSAPRISISTTSPVRGNAAITTQPSSIRNSLQGKNSYIDTTDYSVGKSAKSDSADSVVLKERSTGCQTVVQNGSLNRGCGGATASRRRSTNAPVAKSFAPRYQRLASRQSKVSAQSFVRRSARVSAVRAIAYQPSSSQYYRNRPSRPSYSNNSSNINPNQVVSLEPIIRRGISIALAPLEEYNRATTSYAPAAPDVRQENTDLLFPLPVAVPITSVFGWRTHPVTGRGRMHSGTDLGAPTGTPVLAAYAGEVSMADWSGGYGLMVVLRHLEGTQESRYAHLSEVFVKAGQSVQKGEVIGRVGSTGLSTGPHLHFEWRHLTNNGWVAVDAGTHLEYAMATLMRNQQLASAPARPQG